MRKKFIKIKYLEESESNLHDLTVIMLVVVLALGFKRICSACEEKSKISWAMLELILELLFIGEGHKIGFGKERHSEWERFIMSSELYFSIKSKENKAQISFFE